MDKEKKEWLCTCFTLTELELMYADALSFKPIWLAMYPSTSKGELLEAIHSYTEDKYREMRKNKTKLYRHEQ